MPLQINPEIWNFVERLYIHSYGADKFVIFLKEFDLDYTNQSIYTSMYTEGEGINTNIGYHFMAFNTDNDDFFDFYKFMMTVPKYKYLNILEKIIFDEKLINTSRDNWNYYGERIKYWYPKIVDFIKLAEINIDYNTKKLIYQEREDAPHPEEFFSYPFGEPFLDYIRKELNECYKNQNYLAVMFLSRKLLETLFIRIFEVTFPKISQGHYNELNHDLWFNKNKNRYHDFDKLIENLILKKMSFHEDAELIEEICNKVKPFKDETNKCVHRDYKVPDVDYVNSWKPSEILSLTRKVYKKYCNV